MLVATPALGQGSAPSSSTGIAYSIQLQDPIDPATQKWVSSALDDAASQHAQLAIIRLDTPGGLSDSMRTIIQDMMRHRCRWSSTSRPTAPGRARPAPTSRRRATWPRWRRSPTSARPRRSPSAPTASSQDLSRKIRNDAAAGMRALASAHGRNAHLASLLVSQAKNLAGEGGAQGRPDRRHRAEPGGAAPEARRVSSPGPEEAGPPHLRLIETHDMPFQFQVLEVLVNPNVAYLLILVGISA